MGLDVFHNTSSFKPCLCPDGGKQYNSSTKNPDGFFTNTFYTGVYIQLYSSRVHVETRKS